MHRNLITIITSCLLIFLSLNSYAKSESITEVKLFTQKAIDTRLWEQAEWLNLIHYDYDGDSYNSQVDDANFFYAIDGKTSPRNELIATLVQLFVHTPDDNAQAQCQFTARSEWLSIKLNINKDNLPNVSCDKYNEWRKLTQADSVTMIFPAYHLNSPSSMFGHTLLRLDKSSDTQSEWLSFAVNFGANITSEDNSLIYAYRGLAGGYPGSFITEPYYKKIQEYNRIEHRDIWEYKLNLTPAETERMIKHLWELKTINFDYYFFDENCSYRLLELLEVARPGVELTDEFVVTAIPVDTVRAIEKANMIKETKYRPAQATEIQYTLEKLSENKRNLVMLLSNDIKITESEDFNNLSIEDQKIISNLAYKYLRYQNAKSAREPAVAKRSYQLLQKISSYPANINVETIIAKPYQPEKGHGSKRASFGLGERLKNKYAEFGFKMSFHDLEDNKDGFLQGAQINIGSLSFRAIDNVGIRLHYLNFVDIFSLTPRNEFFDPLSWKVYTGFERQFTKGKDQLTYHVSGGAGGTWKLFKNNIVYALAILRLETNKQLKNTLEAAVGFNTGYLSHFKNTTAKLEFSGEQFEDDIYRLRAQYTQNIVFSINHSVKLFARHQWQENDVDFSDVNLSYQYYF